jgi:hypothetical protein
MDRRPDRGCGLDRSIKFPVFIGYGPVRSRSFSSLETGPSNTIDDYRKYEAWVKVQRNGRIVILGCDRGGEFTSREFTNHLENAGTV